MLAALLICPLALADADPASDVLLAENVFYPYNPPVSASVQATLNAETAAAHRGRFPIKVALIATRMDLGAIPQLYAKPQQYAHFLDQEISFGTTVPVLVVMPNGYGTAGIPATAVTAIASLPKPVPGSNGLAEAAIKAVRGLADAAGHPLRRISRGAAGTGGGSGVAVPLAILLAVCIGLAAAILAVRRRRTPTAPARRR